MPRTLVLPFILPKIYPITDTLVSGLSHARQVELLVAGGASLVQLREKRASPGEQNVVWRGENRSAVGIEEMLRLLRVKRADVDSLSVDRAGEE